MPTSGCSSPPPTANATPNKFWKWKPRQIFRRIDSRALYYRILVGILTQGYGRRLRVALEGDSSFEPAAPVRRAAPQLATIAAPRPACFRGPRNPPLNQEAPHHVPP